ncbi:competence type IV pilus assembly protein ComGB [Bacillus sp. S/N-304-OC-R1]|uniref:competence type IV pilus assembly protein ComGB n=1 Tax=Bacillus sp. S/N-304-OC-R1 TaxID=2758034 RepID=UPI001C8DDC86|nr:competence type IV pilus assembly protein ComGB [Bacillus sp. S/N-304-OC-R1]MBY0122404.1 type II secretion system F family protein [Bacillus sp. S/N-304-OC-R1]
MKKCRWNLQEQSHFLKRTGELLSRGYPLSEAIESILFQLPREKKKEVSRCLSDLREGYPFYQILSRLHFNKNLIGYVYFAEQHGSLAQAFQEGSEMMLKRDKDFEKLKKLLVYPILLIFITIILFLFVDFIILPRFSSLFTSMKLKPNFFMKAITVLSHIMPYLLWAILVFVLLLLCYYFLQFRKKSQIEQKTILISIPIIGPFLKLFYSHYFSIQTSYLLSSGLSIHEALSSFEQNETQPLYQELGALIKESLRKGESLEEILIEYSFLEIELPQIIRHGQKNGKLDQELAFFSRHCLNLIEERSDKLLKTVQPILYSVIGVMIVFMYLAVLLPMFHLLEGF